MQRDATETDNQTTLGAKQEKAADLLVEGKPVSDVASIVDVHRFFLEDLWQSGRDLRIATWEPAEQVEERRL